MSLSPLKLTKTKLLVMDDNPQSMDIIAQILLGFGISHTLKRSSVVDAKKALSSESFDLALLDDEMPGEDGYDLTAWIRSKPASRHYTMPVIIASGSPSNAKVTRARDMGANLVIAKPIIPANLLKKMEWIARNYRTFVTSDHYHGPNRRFQNKGVPEGVEERRSEALNLLESPDRALSQDEINSLFS